MDEQLPSDSSNGPGYNYSMANWIYLQQFAASHCVELIMEINMPAHAANVDFLPLDEMAGFGALRDRLAQSCMGLDTFKALNFGYTEEA